MNYGHLSDQKPSKSGFGWLENAQHVVWLVWLLVIALQRPVVGSGSPYQRIRENGWCSIQMVWKVRQQYFQKHVIMLLKKDQEKLLI
jgi:hypothetical protein